MVQYLIDSSVLGRVELKAEIVSDDDLSEYPSDDLPNQEKDQYWTDYW